MQESKSCALPLGHVPVWRGTDYRLRYSQDYFLMSASAHDCRFGTFEVSGFVRSLYLAPSAYLVCLPGRLTDNVQIRRHRPAGIPACGVRWPHPNAAQLHALASRRFPHRRNPRYSAAPFLYGARWQGRKDLNLRMRGSEPRALPLGDAPMWLRFFSQSLPPRNAISPAECTVFNVFLMAVTAFSRYTR